MAHQSKHTAPARAWLRAGLLTAGLLATGACGRDTGGSGASQPASSPPPPPPAAAPAVPPPAPDTLGTILAGTNIEIRGSQLVCAGGAHVGDTVMATVGGAVLGLNGAVIPVGSPVVGHVTRSEASDSMTRLGQLEIEFDQLTIGGRYYPIDATVIGMVPLVRTRLGRKADIQYCFPPGSRLTVRLNRDTPIRL